MIYPSMQSINTHGAAKGSFNIAVDGFEAAYAAGLLSEFSLNICKADKLYITIIRKNDRSTEYIEEACRLAVVYPCSEVLNEILDDSAGMATMLSDEIYEKSGFKAAERTEEV